MNTQVNFEIAKLLKEKGFPVLDRGYCYNNKGELVDPCFSMWKCEAPTIAEVVMWLYEKHGIWIWVERHSTLFRPYAEEIGDERFGKWEGHKYSSPTAAYEAAITYTLNNLI